MLIPVIFSNILTAVCKEKIDEDSTQHNMPLRLLCQNLTSTTYCKLLHASRNEQRDIVHIFLAFLDV